MSLRTAEFLQSELERNSIPETGTSIQNEPPFLEFIENVTWKEGDDDLLRSMVAKSHSHDPAYLGWQRVRKGLNPCGNFQTGFEGYLVGAADSPGAVRELLLATGIDIWNGIRLEHKHSFQRRNKLEKVIRGESSDPAAIAEWSAILGATLARQRARLLLNPQAKQFQSEVKQQVATLPKIQYVLEAGELRQKYMLPALQPCLSTPLTDGYLTDQEELAAVIMQEIGKFGHPLVRSALRVAHS